MSAFNHFKAKTLMRQGPNSRRSRGRGSNNPGRRSNLPNRNQTFASNGPAVRIRGNAHQVYATYLTLARDASVSAIGRASSRDRVCQYVWISVVDGTLTKK